MSGHLFMSLLIAGFVIPLAASQKTLASAGAAIVGGIIGIAIAWNMLSYTDAKHRHDHEPQIARMR